MRNLLAVLAHWLIPQRVWRYECVGGPFCGGDGEFNYKPAPGESIEVSTEHATHVYSLLGGRLVWCGSVELWAETEQVSE